jgi:hypothetical protein
VKTAENTLERLKKLLSLFIVAPHSGLTDRIREGITKALKIPYPLIEGVHVIPQLLMQLLGGDLLLYFLTDGLKGVVDAVNVLKAVRQCAQKDGPRFGG